MGEAGATALQCVRTVIRRGVEQRKPKGLVTLGGLDQKPRMSLDVIRRPIANTGRRMAPSQSVAGLRMRNRIG